jgi:hypothetical protein
MSEVWTRKREKIAPIVPTLGVPCEVSQGARGAFRRGSRMFYTSQTGSR